MSVTPTGGNVTKITMLNFMGYTEARPAGKIRSALNPLAILNLPDPARLVSSDPICSPHLYIAMLSPTASVPTARLLSLSYSISFRSDGWLCIHRREVICQLLAIPNHGRPYSSFLTIHTRTSSAFPVTRAPAPTTVAIPLRYFYSG